MQVLLSEAGPGDLQLSASSVIRVPGYVLCLCGTAVCLRLLVRVCVCARVYVRTSMTPIVCQCF